MGGFRALFEAAGWNAIVVKYGRRLRQLFAQGKGDVLRRRLDEMTNKEYRDCFGARTERYANACAVPPPTPGLTRLLSDLSDVEVKALIRDLGGHDLADLIDASRPGRRRERPTDGDLRLHDQGLSLPTEGHPGNHSALLSSDQWEELGHTLGASASDPWALFPAGSAEEELCRRATRQLTRSAVDVHGPPNVPLELGRSHRGTLSTQDSVWSFLRGPSAECPGVSARTVTVSPDVASSTSLGGWINRVGVWSLSERLDWFADDAETVMQWHNRRRVST